MKNMDGSSGQEPQRPSHRMWYHELLPNPADLPITYVPLAPELMVSEVTEHQLAALLISR